MADTFKGIITADGKKRTFAREGITPEYASDKTLSVDGGFADAKVTGDVVKSLKEDLVKYNCSELLYSDAVYKSGTSQGITYTWNADKTICEVKGTATGYAASNNIFYNVSDLPKNLNAGEKYYTKFKSNDLKIALQVGFFKDGATSNAETALYINNFILDIPSNCTGMYIRYECSSGIEANGNITNVRIFKNNNSYSLSGPTTVVKTTSTDTNIAGRSFSLIPKKYNRKPILTIIDDDGRNSFYTVYKSLIQRGYPIVCCIDPVNWTGKIDRFMSWEQVHELEEIGCEFIVHGAYPFMIGDNQQYKTADELRLYFEEAQAEFKKQKLSDWDLAVYPQSDHETRLILSEYFRGAFASKEHDDIYYSTPPISQYRIARWFFNYDDLSSGLETAKLQIDGAIANNGWFVICTHSEMFDTDGKAIQTLESIINYAEQNGMSIVNARDGMDMFSNLLQIGDFSNTGSNYNYPCRVIGCDGTEFISPQFENNNISISDGENTIQKIANISNIGNGFCVVTIDAGISGLKAVSTLLKITGLKSKPIIQSFPAVIRINANKYKNVVAVRNGNDILFKESNGDNMLISSSDMTTYTSIELSYIAQMR